MDKRQRYGNEDRLQAQDSEDRPSKDEILKAKFFERSFEKILANIQSLSRISTKDYVVFGLLGLLVLLNIFNTGPGSKGDIRNLSSRVATLERKLLTPDEREGIGMGDLQSPKANAAAREGSSPEAKEEKYDGITESSVKTYRVCPGDSLGTVTWKCYHTQEQSTVTALGLYNGLKPPHFDIYVDQELKIPLLSELYGWYDFHKKTKNKK